jgi:hypothetical protein
MDPVIAIASTPATRDAALLIPEAAPASFSDTKLITVVVRGATVSPIPTAPMKSIFPEAPGHRVVSITFFHAYNKINPGDSKINSILMPYGVFMIEEKKIEIILNFNFISCTIEVYRFKAKQKGEKTCATSRKV